MRTGLLTTVAIAAVAFSGVAQASVITETFTGSITSGIDRVGAFGATGASLAGDTVTFSFSYDIGLLQADINAGTHGSGRLLNPSNYDQYDDRAGDSAFTESVTVNSQTIAITNSSNSGVAAVEGCMVAVCGGANGLFVLTTWLGSGEYIQTQLFTTQNYSTGDDLFSQYEVDALVGSGATTGSISVYNGVATDNLAIGNVSSESPATPEPTTWVSLALGAGMVGLLKRRRGLIS